MASLPNLDAMGDEELKVWAQALEAGARYAQHILSARSHRTRGRIAVAQGFEEQAEGFYARIPEELRW